MQHGQNGWYKAQLFLDLESGCRQVERSGTQMPAASSTPDDLSATITHQFAVPSKVARATYTLLYRPGDVAPSDMSAERILFSQTRVLNGAITLPENPPPCVSAKPTTPAPRSNSREEQAATLINLAGYLCGRVTDAYASGGGTITVHCTEYRDGRGHAKYRIFTNSGQVEKLE